MIDLLEFQGRIDPNVFVEWLQIVEQMFDYKDIPQLRRVKLMALKLKKNASLWSENLKHMHQCEGKS